MLASDGVMRPTPKTALPFVRKKGIDGKFFLEYQETTPTAAGDKRQTFALFEYTRPYKAVVELMTLYRDLEAQIDGLTKERDEALEEVARLRDNGKSVEKGAKAQRQGKGD